MLTGMALLRKSRFLSHICLYFHTLFDFSLDVLYLFQAVVPW